MIGSELITRVTEVLLSSTSTQHLLKVLLDNPRSLIDDKLTEEDPLFQSFYNRTVPCMINVTRNHLHDNVKAVVTKLFSNW